MTHIDYQETSILDLSVDARKSDMQVDEDRTPLLQAVKAADNLLADCEEKLSESVCKETIVPLQGEHWKSWSDADKEAHRMQLIGVEDSATHYVAKKGVEKEESRRKQINVGVSKEMKIIIEFLVSRF